MRAVKESHHFYPVLVYFRFNEPYYRLSRLTTILLDAVTLIKSGLDDEEFASLKESAAVNGICARRCVCCRAARATSRPPAPTRPHWTAGGADMTPDSGDSARPAYGRSRTSGRRADTDVPNPARESASSSASSEGNDTIMRLAHEQ